MNVAELIGVLVPISTKNAVVCAGLAWIIGLAQVGVLDSATDEHSSKETESPQRTGRIERMAASGTGNNAIENVSFDPDMMRKAVSVLRSSVRVRRHGSTFC